MLFHCRQTKTQFNIKSMMGNWQKIFSIISTGSWENSVPQWLKSSESSSDSLTSSPTKPYMDEPTDDCFLVRLEDLHVDESVDFVEDDRLDSLLPDACEALEDVVSFFTDVWLLWLLPADDVWEQPEISSTSGSLTWRKGFLFLWATYFTIQQSLSLEFSPFSLSNSEINAVCLWRFCSLALRFGRFCARLTFREEVDVVDELLEDAELEGAIISGSGETRVRASMWACFPSLEKYAESSLKLFLSAHVWECKSRGEETEDLQLRLSRSRWLDNNSSLQPLPHNFEACSCTFVAVVKPVAAKGNVHEIWSKRPSLSLVIPEAGRLNLGSFTGFTRKFTSSFVIPFLGVK